MLLDKYVLTQGFSNLLSHSPTTPPSTTFPKRVSLSMGRLDPLIKVLQVRPSPAEGLVQAYLIHIGDRSDANFRKVLELKGVRKIDQAHLVELFQIHRDSTRSGGPELVQSSNLMSQVVLGDGKGAIAAATAIASGGLAMNTRFDAGAFGEKLFSAARDGVERIGSTGSPALGGSATAGREGSVERGSMDGNRPGVAAQGMNENLRNIGKFFRRDMGSFGGRFGRGQGSVDDTVR